ncbi:porin [Mesorhizobium sp. CC13]|uniref:porin n=1 Tax=Mesorhizobium sp. CC13 TaxID=3029194 RepID=UPI003264AD4D
MTRSMKSLALAAAMLAPQAAGAAPLEYVRVCSTYGPGFFYIPGTDRCYRPSDGQIRYETEDGTVVTQTPFAARLDELEAAAAISNALEDPDLVAGETFGLRLNLGVAGSQYAVGITGAFMLSDEVAGKGTRLTGSGGLGFADGQVGARIGLQLAW